MDSCANKQQIDEFMENCREGIFHNQILLEIKMYWLSKYSLRKFLKDRSS